MALSTYSELQTEIAAWLHRSDISSSQVQNFITLGESRLNDALRLRSMETTSSLTLSASANTISLPTGFLEPISLWYSDGYALEQASRQVLDASRNSAVGNARPGYYAFSSTTIDFERTADVAYTLTLRYFKKWDLAGDTTNTLMLNRPGAYLYASLMCAGLFLRDSDLTQSMTQLFNQEVSEAIANDGRSRGSAALESDIAIAGHGLYDIQTDGWR